MALLLYQHSARSIPLDKKLTTLSASADADIVLPDASDSVCYIEKKQDGSCHLETIKGKGITINGRTVKHLKLEFGDRIETRDGLTVFLDIDKFEQKTEEEKHFNELTLLLNNNDLKSVSRIILGKLISETHAEKGIVLLLEGGEPSLLVGAEKDGMEFLSGFSETIIKTVLLDKKPLLSNNVLTDQRFSPSKSIVALKIMATIVVPIVRGGTIDGVVYLWNSDPGYAFSEDTLGITGFYAWIFSLLIENNRMKQGMQTSVKQTGSSRQPTVWHGLVTLNQDMLSLFEQCNKWAQTDSPVVLYGEEGTGKKSIAKALHEIAAPNGPLHMIRMKNKSADVLSDEFTLLSTTDFTAAGYQKPATIIVDGLDYLPEDGYAAMTALIDKFSGSRWIFCMEQNPDSGTIRFDERLRARLGEVLIHVPSLRERTEDIIPLASRFLDEFSRVYGKNIAGFSEQAAEALQASPWKGNVAHLRDVVQKAVIAADADIVERDVIDMEEPGTRLTPLGKAKEDFMRRYVKMALDITGGDKIKAADMLRVSHRTIYKYLED